MDDEQLLRYSRHILLPQLDIAGQQKLLDSKVLIIGLGGLGCPVAMYLAAAGIGHLTVMDGDQVELTNLQRQLAYTSIGINQPKAESIMRSIKVLNPSVNVKPVNEYFDKDNHHSILENIDVVVDATDNSGARRAINEVCFMAKVPLVFAAVIRFEGQLSVFDPRQSESPCYECIYGQTQVNENCSQSGVLGPVAGCLGAMQATETIKVLLGIGEIPIGKLQLYDALASQWHSIKVKARADCPVCRAIY